ncbi:MAG: A/G-specific adenine glycosylase [Bryobacteraceae bacterium]|nr:A/G-specific adenine glycosylase [Bryobacteraceae bacterium]
MFSGCLLEWYCRGHRDLPWRRTSDPYAIWVSEIMLQQTRVAAVIPYYERFLARFPTPQSLAAAAEDELLGSWAGLGYYSRVRNMQRAAREMNGRFPSTWEAMRQLPGIGDYTASAVASIAFGLPHAAVDGNVLRVLSRVTNDAGDIGSSLVKSRLAAAAEARLDREQPGRYNQALMELGATVCLPKSPQCLVCPVASFCQARAAGSQNALPVKLRRAEIHRKTRRVYVVQHEGSVLLWRRTEVTEKLVGFWELPEAEQFQKAVPAGVPAGTFRHSITNHQYTFEVVQVHVQKSRPSVLDGIESRWASIEQLHDVVLSTTARKAFMLLSVLAM